LPVIVAKAMTVLAGPTPVMRTLDNNDGSPSAMIRPIA
jgi:hypothetical protein